MRDMSQVVSGTDVKNPWKQKHNIAATRESVRQLLANGTPNWVKWPEDYKNFVKESFQAEKEASDNQVSCYKMEHQSILMNAKARKVNAISTRDFIQKLRQNGVKCFTVDNGFPPQTVALWAIRPNAKDVQYICYLQVPAMYEWSILKVDRHGLPAGEDFRGWRVPLVQMIAKGIVTEAWVNKVFGKATDSEVSLVYRESLFHIRNHIKIDQGPVNYEL
jgi:hypothetical protein